MREEAAAIDMREAENNEAEISLTKTKGGGRKGSSCARLVALRDVAEDGRAAI